MVAVGSSAGRPNGASATTKTGSMQEGAHAATVTPAGRHSSRRSVPTRSRPLHSALRSTDTLLTPPRASNARPLGTRVRLPRWPGASVHRQLTPTLLSDPRGPVSGRRDQVVSHSLPTAARSRRPSARGGTPLPQHGDQLLRTRRRGRVGRHSRHSMPRPALGCRGTSSSPFSQGVRT